MYFMWRSYILHLKTLFTKVNRCKCRRKVIKVVVRSSWYWLIIWNGMQQQMRLVAATVSLPLVAWLIGSIGIFAVIGAWLATRHLFTIAVALLTFVTTVTGLIFSSRARNITSAFSLNTSVLAIARRCRIVSDDNEDDKQKSKSLKTVEMFRITCEYGILLKNSKRMFLPYQN